ncbi:hypothetical protein K505DRAFT_302752 [Melanomma pulvis-pyrius CBS 109.77]|uniref:Uncharacterized protein n=1 Tax=Melanomma pulvis-pyrius CBS 109.77 TaxID=1314802 RepID=A0A6A6XEV8_9PLEO|nr:hypothetical protein K505DRAFT_302752 [Melanomma pulvis-pyrius CBS 109.77]
MSTNWINHTPSATPLIKTNDDIQHVAPSQISDFFILVQKEFLHGATQSGGSLPQQLHDEASACDASLVAGVLGSAVGEGSVMDSGWIDDYFCICERVSGAMGGYPKVCLQQWRAVRDAIAGRMIAHDGARAASTRNKSAKKEEKPFRFLDLPEQIRRKIYRLVVPHGTLIVSDWAFGSVPSSVLRRTEYDVLDVNGELRRTTYTVHSATPVYHLQLNLMLTNRSVAREISEQLYSCKFEFRGTASGTLAFLHDHMLTISRLKRVSLRYTTTSRTPFLGCTFVDSKPPPTLKTNIGVWRKILNTLVSSASALEDFELVVDKNFWERALWREGAAAVMEDRALCEVSQKRSGVRNFLVDVSRLSGVNFRLVIEGCAADQVKRTFQRELEKYVNQQIQASPYVAEKKSACSCRKRLLSEACAWEEETKRRRL